MNEKEYRIVETAWLGEGIPYTGAELRSHIVRELGGIRGDGVIAFVGPCTVEEAALVDLEDAEQENFIRARSMLHFLGEHFLVSLREGNYLLRLFAMIVREGLEELLSGQRIVRVGDDLFIDKRKLSVAIATASPTSVLFHFGINVDPAGAPVPAVGLVEFGLEAERLARIVLERYRSEIVSVELALRKVRGVP
ncbi:MAG: DUF366 family protein [bacterium]|nr:MAG: DUF366 family protein [bacterium]